MPFPRALAFLALATIPLSAYSAAQGIYQTPEDFLREVFADDLPEPSKLWMMRNSSQVSARFWT